MAPEPKVTGLSPMTGPPGTKITVRGENFGQSGEDIIKLTINGADCLPYLEWKSPKKIITRCSRALGSGDVLLTTKSGGAGTCDVQFNCYDEIVGPTDEAAIWVNEIDFQAPEKEKLSISGSYEEYSVEFSSTRFKPQLYLLHNHSNSNLRELEQLHKRLNTELCNKSDPEVISSSSNRAAFLKSNLPVIMECLQILEHLNKVLTSSKDTSIETIVTSIKSSLTKTHELFDPLLAQKDLVQSIESAMQVFRQNETLFNLPSAIESSIKSKNYDSVVKEIAAVISRLKTINCDQNLTEKIQQDVTNKVSKLKVTIEDQLHQSCKCENSERNIDEVKKLISHLNRLGGPSSYDLWDSLEEMSESLIDTLTKSSDHFLELCLNDSDAMDASPSEDADRAPYVVQFVQSATSTFQRTYDDILALGQSYFDQKDEFSCKESHEIMQARSSKFEDTMILRPIVYLCNLLRLALVPDSSKLEKPSRWPSDESYVNWLRTVLQSVISCNSYLCGKNLPPVARVALEDFREFVFELRVRSMQILFGSATRINKNLHNQEDWAIEVDDTFGGRTKLPLVFEKNVIDTLRFANETIFQTSLPGEKSILKRVDVQASMKELTHSLINSFIDSLDNALIDNKEHPAEATRSLLASRDSSRAQSKYMNRLLVTICNCQFTKDQVFLRLQDEFEKLNGLKMDRVFKFCNEKYCDYIAKISDKFCRIKCTELSKNLNLEDSQINLMIVNSQIFLVAPQLVNTLMTSIVNMMQNECI